MVLDISSDMLMSEGSHLRSEERRRPVRSEQTGREEGEMGFRESSQSQEVSTHKVYRPPHIE